MAITKKTKKKNQNPNAGKDVEKGDLLPAGGGNVNRCNCYGEVKLVFHLSSSPASGYTKHIEEICTPTLTVAQFTIAKT
jgi:hypothetical protein